MVAASLITPVKRALHKGWHASTSADAAGWSRANPAWGQCAVSALYVQEKLGGELIRVTYETPDGRTGSHYLNLLLDGSLLDLTAQQFPAGTVLKPTVLAPVQQLVDATQAYVKSTGFDGSVRDYVLSHPATAARYDALCSAIEPRAAKGR